ncbi:MAG: hypothetical protein EZS28_050634, partial [Streblomastix strix]
MNSQPSANSQESDQTTIQDYLSTQNGIEQPQFDTAQPDDAFLAFVATDL